MGRLNVISHFVKLVNNLLIFGVNLRIKLPINVKILLQAYAWKWKFY